MYGTSILLTLATISSAILVGGLIALLLGNLTGIVREQLNLREKGETGLKVAFISGLMVFLVLGGLLVDQLGVKDGLILGSIGACFSIACLGLSREYRGAIISAALVGGAAGFLHVAVTVSMPHAFYGPEYIQHQPAAANFGYIFIALGSLLVPFLTVYTVNQLKFRNGFLALALLALIPAFIAGLTSHSLLPQPARGANLGKLLADTRFWMAVIAVFFFYAVESSALRWAPNYLVEIGLSARAQLILLVAFWGVFLFSRLVASSLGNVLAAIWVVMILAFLSAVLMGNMIGVYRAKTGSTSFLVLGGCLGPIFPTLAGIILYIFQDQPAMAFGLVCALASLGRLAFVPVVNMLVENKQVRLAMGVTMVLALVVFFPALVWLTLPR